MLFWVCVCCAAVAGTGFYLARQYEGSLIFLGVIYGGLSFTIYGLSVAHVNDLIDSSRVLEVTGGLLLLYGIGATVGPTLGGAMMDWLGPESLMLYFAVVLAVLALSVWRYVSAKPLQVGDPGHKADYVVMGSGSQAVLQMDPRRESQPSVNATLPDADSPRS